MQRAIGHFHELLFESCFFFCVGGSQVTIAVEMGSSGAEMSRADDAES